MGLRNEIRFRDAAHGELFRRRGRLLPSLRFFQDAGEDRNEAAVLEAVLLQPVFAAADAWSLDLGVRHGFLGMPTK